MNHPMTWESYWNYRLLVGAVTAAVLLAGALVARIEEYFEDQHVNDEPDEDEPRAGKTLGL